ncbi:Predicted dinucleotide-binding enzyme [Fructobacillus cardui]|nr:Predicted dinucleotide-binding enzyme [Fructobacillus cardui]
MNVTVFGKGNIGSAVGAQLEKAGDQVDYVTTEHKADTVADLVSWPSLTPL